VTPDFKHALNHFPAIEPIGISRQVVPVAMLKSHIAFECSIHLRCLRIMVWLIRTKPITHFPQLIAHIIKTALKLLLFANKHLLGMHIALTLPFDLLNVGY
jgi:hypothetical protein